MPENINWSGVWQSIADTWLPMFGWLAVIAAVIIIIAVLRKRKK